MNSDQLVDDLDIQYRGNISTFSKFAILRMYVKSSNEELVELYQQHVENHNKAVLDCHFPNSGFDVFVPHNTVFTEPCKTKMINMEIKCEMVYCESKHSMGDYCAYYMFPRSSLSKTPLVLANHTGIIDSGYRGELIGAFKWFKYDEEESYVVEKHTRLLQICHPSLCPIFVKMVSEDEITTTTRGEDGFGSTGLAGAI
jgi:dUTP pyrophosphatase